MSDERRELAEVAASLRAYLEIQADSGATGIPRLKEGLRPSSDAARPHLPAPPDPPVSEPAISLEPATVQVPVSESVPLTVRALPVLEQVVAGCTKCELSKTRIKTVFSRGNPKSQLCFVGEAPGADEDEQGVPFVGKAGQLLDRMITAMGLKPDEVYVCNIIKCRPPGNRRPTGDEVAACIPYLHEQLSNVSPKIIVAMGNTAAQALLDTKLGITRLRGEWKLYRGKTLLMPTYHPSYLLRESPIQKLSKQEAWEDLQKVMKELGLPAPAKGAHPPGYKPPEEAPTPSVAFPPSTKKE